ncbi:MAG: hypothetical protein HOQ09_05915 [Gemmatimonadaceae bacterium]|nr:hypothetical protein [Gemmatimonadaceae bacterium]
MKIRSTMIALAIMAGAAATAGAQQTTAPKQGARAERDSTRRFDRQARRKDRDDRDDRADREDRDDRGDHGDRADRGDRGDHGDRGMRAPRALMRGVNLTDAQKSQIRAIHQKYQAQFKSIRDANKPARDEARAARQRGDTAAARAAFEKSRDQFQSLRQQELNEVRGVLTPDQQTTFDANVQRMQTRHERHGKRGDRDAQ